ncbi:MAG: IPT/TIG domain-containing protein [Bacteroidetes bacterium]|nr:IPT/TIG domain-containing protein [Bacteroidota bacterium]
MKKFLYNYLFISIIATGLFLISLTGCTDKGDPSLFQGVPTSPIGATPSITSISPSTALAGYTQLIITGQNFSANPAEDLIYFNGNMVTATSATPTQLVLTAPNVYGDSVKINVAVLNSEQFSNSIYFAIKQTAKDFYPGVKDQTDIPMSMVSDNAGNIYSSNNALGVYQITPDSVSTLYSPKGGETFWTSMRFGPGGVMYCARGLQALFTIPAGGGVKNSTWVVLPSTAKLNQLEFDPLGNLWAAGKNSVIYRIKQDKSYVTFPFTANVTAMRVFVDGGTTYLYVAAQQDSLTTIQRMPIDASGNLGTATTYFDFSKSYGANWVVNGIDFAADGEMFLATNMPQPLIYVNTDKSTGALYPSVIQNSPALGLIWGSGNYLYYIRRQINDATGVFLIPQSIVKLDILKPGAPYYGQ